MPAWSGRRSRTILVLMGALSSALGSPQARANPTRPTGPTVPSLLIVENAGQFDPAVRFQVRTSQEILWLTDHSLWLSALEPKPEISRDEPLDRPAGPNAGGSVATPHGVNLHLTFPGSRPGASLVAARPLPTRVNYFLGSDRSRWQSGVRTYRAVTWRGLYPGISVTLSGVQGAPALTVRAGPGTDPAAFRLRVAGARDLRASPEGRLVADTGVGPLTLPAILHDGRGLGSAVHGTVVSFTGSPGSPPARRPAGNVNASGGKGLEYG